MVVQVFEDLEAVSVAAAELIVSEAAGKDVFKLALSGGNTPRRLHELLSTEPFRSRIDWSKVHIFFGDERWVPPTDPASNEGMARETLLSKVPIPESQVHPMYREGSLSDAVKEYESLLSAESPLDLVILGIGDDGHTASLFPGGPELSVRDSLVTASISPKGVPERITMTIPALRLAGVLLFLATGAGKHEKLGEALDAESPSPPPSGMVAHQAKQAFWFVDKSAIDG